MAKSTFKKLISLDRWNVRADAVEPLKKAIDAYGGKDEVKSAFGTASILHSDYPEGFCISFDTKEDAKLFYDCVMTA